MAHDVYLVMMIFLILGHILSFFRQELFGFIAYKLQFSVPFIKFSLNSHYSIFVEDNAILLKSAWKNNYFYIMRFIFQIYKYHGIAFFCDNFLYFTDYSTDFYALAGAKRSNIFYR